MLKELTKQITNEVTSGSTVESETENMDKQENTCCKKCPNNFLDECNNAKEIVKCIVIFQVETNSKISLNSAVAFKQQSTKKKIIKDNFKVNSFFLVTKSQIAKEMFFGKSNKCDFIQIKDQDTFKNIINFLDEYSANLVTLENSRGLFLMSLQFHIKYLFIFGKGHLAHNLNLTNIAFMLNASVVFESIPLKMMVFYFIYENQSQVFPSNCFDACTREALEYLLDMPCMSVAEDSYFEVLYNWAQYQLKNESLPLNKFNLKKILEPFDEFIEFCSLSTEKLKFVLDNDLCSEETRKNIEQIYAKKK